MAIWLFLFAALFAPLYPTHAAALRADFNALAPRPRSSAPTPVEVKLHFQGAGLLEGVLELTLLADGSPILRQRTQELALAAGSQTQRLLLPPRSGGDYIPTTDVHLRFIGKNGVIDLGRFPVSASGYGTRSHLIGICGAPVSPSEDMPRLWQTLRPDRFMAESTTGTPKVVTAPMMMDPADLPASPLALCAFDLVLLEGDSFAKLREKQLAALARWVEAGGSLCVIAGGVLGEEHLRFLNQFTDKSDFALDERGHLVAPAGNMKMIRAELGRFVVAAKAPETAPAAAAAAWTDAALFLWKLPPGAKPNTPISTAQSGIVTQRQPTPNWQRDSSGEQRRDAIRQYLNKLLPQSTRLIPLPVIGGLLGAFVLIVGPGDWFVLGWLRRRRWTWFTFPLVAAAFTAVTVVAAEHYLGAEDMRSELVITDVGRGGRVLRESRLELLFAARDKEVATELRQSLAVPTAFGTRQYRNNQAPTAPALYDGQFPARATLRQRLQQWTPQVNRLLTFENTDDNSGIRWDAVTAKQLAGKPNAAKWFADRAGGAGFHYLVFHRGKLLGTTADGNAEVYFLKQLSYLPRNPEAAPGSEFSDLAALARKDPDGWLVSAPRGDGDLADLALAAEHDPRVWLVAAVKQTPAETRIYRRIYHTDE